MAELTDYGRAIKHRLIDMGMTQSQLISQVKVRSGLYCDCSLLGKVLTGKCNRSRITEAINEILDISDCN